MTNFSRPTLFFARHRCNIYNFASQARQFPVIEVHFSFLFFTDCLMNFVLRGPRTMIRREERGQDSNKPLERRDGGAAYRGARGGHVTTSVEAGSIPERWTAVYRDQA